MAGACITASEVPCPGPWVVAHRSPAQEPRLPGQPRVELPALEWSLKLMDLSASSPPGRQKKPPVLKSVSIEDNSFSLIRSMLHLSRVSSCNRETLLEVLAIFKFAYRTLCCSCIFTKLYMRLAMSFVTPFNAFWWLHSLKTILVAAARDCQSGLITCTE